MYDPRRRYNTRFDKTTKEWKTILLNEYDVKEKILVTIKNEKQKFVTYEFYQNEAADYCRFVDEITGQLKEFSKCKGWELTSYKNQKI